MAAWNEFIGRGEVEWEHLLAASFVAIVPVVALFLIVQMHLVGGLTAGSVK
ncbi:hypothetical protein [Angustibacter sp. Root456]|uniref:hypothetical protein n=1 Tax=Angustibacter sp. Root456 TaxID=1736539 RepID=UPI0012FA791C|nr:hypothetical protein [Angustibacter sp. Root456]